MGYYLPAVDRRARAGSWPALPPGRDRGRGRTAWAWRRPDTAPPPLAQGHLGDGDAGEHAVVPARREGAAVRPGPQSHLQAVPTGTRPAQLGRGCRDAALSSEAGPVPPRPEPQRAGAAGTPRSCEAEDSPRLRKRRSPVGKGRVRRVHPRPPCSGGAQAPAASPGHACRPAGPRGSASSPLRRVRSETPDRPVV